MVRVICASLLLTPLTVLAAASPALALRRAPTPDNVAEITITGDISEEGFWYGEAELPVVIGVVVEGTQRATERLKPGDRLALIEVIAGLRLDEIQTHIEVVGDGLIGWGGPHYVKGDYVFLRLEYVVDVEAGLAVGFCTWGSQARTEAQIADLLVLAEEHGVAIVFPIGYVEAPDTETPSTSTRTQSSGQEDSPIDEAPPDEIESEVLPDQRSSNANSGTSTAVLFAFGFVGLASLTAGGYVVVRRRHQTQTRS